MSNLKKSITKPRLAKADDSPSLINIFNNSVSFESPIDIGNTQTGTNSIQKSAKILDIRLREAKNNRISTLNLKSKEIPPKIRQIGDKTGNLLRFKQQKLRHN